ncbi:hypothetical protein G7Y89_g2575 [Cudoniella acicularis]|uniref:Uncharacterized protein n=1 Tax=Cudoniella acicularis TaxID=354080 RepID=A0A8H4W983_9HELO|nr:hypothetical protein G7Y89_g2575 [Cudoniella acicularis]
MTGDESSAQNPLEPLRYCDIRFPLILPSRFLLHYAFVLLEPTTPSTIRIMMENTPAGVAPSYSPTRSSSSLPDANKLLSKDCESRKTEAPNSATFLPAYEEPSADQLAENDPEVTAAHLAPGEDTETSEQHFSYTNDINSNCIDDPTQTFDLNLIDLESDHLPSNQTSSDLLLPRLGQSKYLWSSWTTSDDYFPHLDLSSSEVIHPNPLLLASLRMSNPAAQNSATLVMQYFRSTPQMMLRRDNFPPFIHAHWSHEVIQETNLPISLANCMNIAQLFTFRTSETSEFLRRTILAEQDRVTNEGGMFVVLDQPCPRSYPDWAAARDFIENSPQHGMTFFGDLIEAHYGAGESINARKLDIWNAGIDNLGMLLNLSIAMV